MGGWGHTTIPRSPNKYEKKWVDGVLEKIPQKMRWDAVRGLQSFEITSGTEKENTS